LQDGISQPDQQGPPKGYLVLLHGRNSSAVMDTGIVVAEFKTVNPTS